MRGLLPGRNRLRGEEPLRGQRFALAMAFGAFAVFGAQFDQGHEGRSFAGRPAVVEVIGGDYGFQPVEPLVDQQLAHVGSVVLFHAGLAVLAGARPVNGLWPA